MLVKIKEDAKSLLNKIDELDSNDSSFEFKCRDIILRLDALKGHIQMVSESKDVTDNWKERLSQKLNS